LFVDASGNILVGKTSSSGLLAGCELRPSGYGLFTRDGNPSIQVRRLTSDGPVIEFYKDSLKQGDISVASGGMAFGSGPLATERLRIDSSGRVGIGTSSPAQLLHISSGGNTRARISTTSTSSFGQLYIGDDQDKFLIGYGPAHLNQPDDLALRNNTGDIFFATGTAASIERMRITAAGNVGVGTTSPARLLHLQKASGGGMFTIERTDATTSALVVAADPGDIKLFARNTNSGSTAIPLVFMRGGSDESMRIDSSGRVGIGTSSPTLSAGTGLHLRDSNTGIRLNPSSNGGQGYIEFADESNTVQYTSGYRDANTSYNICPGSNLSIASGLHINTSGDVGIGTTSPASDAQLTIDNGGTGDVAIFLRRSGSAQGDAAIANEGSDITFSVGSSDTVAGLNEAVRIDSSGRVGVGTSSPGAPLTVSNSGNNKLTLTGGTNQNGLTFDGANGSDSYYIYTSSLGLNFYNTTDSVSALTIDNSNRVGVGTTSPVRDLQLGDNTSTSEILSLQTTTSGDCSIYFGDNTATSAEYAGMLRYSHGSDAMQFRTSSLERLRIDSSGRVGIGTSSPNTKLDVAGNSTTYTDAPAITFTDTGSGQATANRWIAGNIAVVNYGDFALAVAPDTTSTSFSPKIVVTEAGNVGIGTTSPSYPLDVNGAIRSDGTSGGLYFGGNSTTPSVGSAIHRPANDTLAFVTTSTERARITSDGKLLVGTSTARSVFSGGNITTGVQVDGTQFGDSTLSITRGSADNGTPGLVFGKSRSTGNSVVSSGDGIGIIAFEGNDGAKFLRGAQIQAFVDGTPGTNDMPGRLVFSTTADGASSPTERMRIVEAGHIYIGRTNDSATAAGSSFYADGFARHNRNNNTIMILNRGGTDGTMVSFLHAGTTEGSITVSGTTVSYNGGHLSRWSQLPGNVERTEILRGSVLSNIDEMCDWGEEENEQLNRMKVSDVEGDKNVSGVFQAWDDDDDTYTNDFYCAMTGDFIIRIAQGVTVERGDLLMSAGDGTAKPQDDDIIRSKTIAKVTSTNVSCTYDDGSYCVPCVLMAC
jgi:hypothetical protein